MHTQAEIRERAIAQEHARIESLQTSVSTMVEELDADAQEPDHDRIRSTLQTAHQLDPGLFGRLNAAFSGWRARREASESARRETQRQASQGGIPGKLAAMRRVLEGDSTFSPDERNLLEFLKSSPDVGGADRAVLAELEGGHRERWRARQVREAAEAELAERAARDRAVRERERAWRSLPREVRAGYLLVAALPDALKAPFRALLCILQDQSFDPAKVPDGWQPGSQRGGAELIAAIPSTLPFEPRNSPPRSEPQRRNDGRNPYFR